MRDRTGVKSAGDEENLSRSVPLQPLEDDAETQGKISGPAHRPRNIISR